MTDNISSERALEKGKKTAKNYYYQEVPENEKRAGTSERDLGARWGLGAGESGNGGRVTRKGSRVPQIPGGLVSVQEEHESPPGEISLDLPDSLGGDRRSLDQPETSGGDRRDLDQPTPVGGDRSEEQGLDQSEKSDGDRPDDLETEEDRDKRSEDEGRKTTDEDGTWKQVKKRRRQSGVSDAAEVEEDLMDTKGSDGDQSPRYFPGWFDKNGNRIEDDEDEPAEPELESETERAKSGGERTREGKRRSRHGKRIDSSPTRPAGFRQEVTSISMIGRRDAPMGKRKPQIATSVVFGRRKDEMPQGMKFMKSRERRTGERKGASHGRRDPPPSESPSVSESDPDEEDRGRRRKETERQGREGRGRRKIRRPSSSSSSSSPSSRSSSPPSSSSRSRAPASSDPSSDSESDRRRSRRKDRKRKSRRSGGRKAESKAERDERKALERHRVSLPSEYDGKADLAVFDKWTYEVSTWARLSKYRDPTALSLLSKQVTGQAGKFFLHYIADNEDAWTLKSMFEAMFDYCFPTDFKDQLRARLEGTVQGKKRVRDFVREVELLAARFPDVNERSRTQIIWKGFTQSIRLRLIEWGVSPEYSPLEKIVRKAVDIENREETYKRELRVTKSPPPERKWGRFSST